MSEITYIVAQGDCISSIAFEHGFFPDTLWNHAENEALKAERKQPSSLMPGDEVFIPEMESGSVDCATEARHTFRRRGVPAMLRLQFFDDAEPRAGVPYTLTIDGIDFAGKTDADGKIEVKIPPNARDGKLLLGPAGHQEVMELELGHLDPVEELSGVRARLENLGFEIGAEESELGPETAEALRRFQAAYGLEVSGVADDATVDKLRELDGE